MMVNYMLLDSEKYLVWISNVNSSFVSKYERPNGYRVEERKKGRLLDKPMRPPAVEIRMPNKSLIDGNGRIQSTKASEIFAFVSLYYCTQLYVTLFRYEFYISPESR